MVACFVCVVWGQLVWCSSGLRLLRLPQGVGPHVQRSPASWFEQPLMEPGFSTHRHSRTTQRCEIRALMPKCGPVATACVSSLKDWAVLIGSHMQQEVDISFGASYAHPSSFGLCINRNAKHKLKQLHVGEPCSRRGV